jgi:hypothetical protein
LTNKLKYNIISGNTRHNGVPLKKAKKPSRSVFEWEAIFLEEQTENRWFSFDKVVQKSVE